MNNITLINKKENIFGDNIAFVENWDFSKANLSNENRIHAITLIASVCYQNPKALNSDSLYNRLMAESKGLPSSSFEFVPILFSMDELEEKYCSFEDFNIFKYGEKVEDGKYLLTNYRAVVYDYEESTNNCVDLRERFNTEEECHIIAKHFTVIKSHIDIPSFGQFVRHRINWQVLSRRYVSGKKTPFEFYNSEKMKFSSVHTVGYEDKFTLDENDFIEICLERYNQAIERGVKPEEARRCIPQSAYTTAWCAMQPKQLENFFKLRLDSHAQKEIRLVAEAVQELLYNKKQNKIVKDINTGMLSYNGLKFTQEMQEDLINMFNIDITYIIDMSIEGITEQKLFNTENNTYYICTVDSTKDGWLNISKIK